MQIERWQCCCSSSTRSSNVRRKDSQQLLLLGETLHETASRRRRSSSSKGSPFAVFLCTEMTLVSQQQQQLHERDKVVGKETRQRLRRSATAAAVAPVQHKSVATTPHASHLGCTYTPGSSVATWTSTAFAATREKDTCLRKKKKRRDLFKPHRKSSRLLETLQQQQQMETRRRA